MGTMGEMAHGGGMTDPFTARTLCEWPMVTALLLIFGLGAFVAAIVPSQSSLSEFPGLWKTVRGLTLLVIALAPIQLLTGVASMAGTAFAQALPLAPEVVRQTHFGNVWLASTPLLVGLAAVAWIPWRSRWCASLVGLIGATLLALQALVSHAIDFGTPAITFYFVHQAAAGLWGGALLGLSFMAGPGDMERPATRLIVRRVSRLAGWCVAMLVASGVYIAYCALGLNLDHLLYSAYGRTLIAKVAVFGMLVALGGYNRYRLLPRLGVASARSELIRSVHIECLLMTAVLGLAVLLANTPPAH